MKYSGFPTKIATLALLSIFISNFETKASEAKANPLRQDYTIYVDKEGVMRRSDTKEEVAYYGTNYTLPFAHAYRAIEKLGIDHKEAIDKDVYHLKRW